MSKYILKFPVGSSVQVLQDGAAYNIRTEDRTTLDNFYNSDFYKYFNNVGSTANATKPILLTVNGKDVISDFVKDGIETCSFGAATYPHIVITGTHGGLSFSWFRDKFPVQVNEDNTLAQDMYITFTQLTQRYSLAKNTNDNANTPWFITNTTYNRLEIIPSYSFKFATGTDQATYNNKKYPRVAFYLYDTDTNTGGVALLDKGTWVYDANDTTPIYSGNEYKTAMYDFTLNSEKIYRNRINTVADRDTKVELIDAYCVGGDTMFRLWGKPKSQTNLPSSTLCNFVLDELFPDLETPPICYNHKITNYAIKVFEIEEDVFGTGTTVNGDVAEDGFTGGSGNTEDIGGVEGYVNTHQSVYRFENGKWVPYKLDADMLLAGSIGAREISSEYIYGGTIYADQIGVSSNIDKNKFSGFTINEDAIYRNNAGLGVNGNGNIYLGTNGFSLSNQLVYNASNGKLNLGDNVALTWGTITGEPSLTKGDIYLGKEGLKLGDALTYNNTTKKLTLGGDVVISWDNISDKPDIPSGGGSSYSGPDWTYRYTTDIGYNWLTTSKIYANDLNITGGKVDINTSSKDESIIKLNCGTASCQITPSTITVGDSVSNGIVTKGTMIDGAGDVITTGYFQGSSLKLSGHVTDLSGNRLYSAYDHGHYSDTLYATQVGSTNYKCKVYLDPNDTSSTSAANLRIASASGGWINYRSSSRRDVKHDIVPVAQAPAEIAPERLYDVDVVSFKYNDDYINENDCRYQKDMLGFIIDDMMDTYPIGVDVEDGVMTNWNEKMLIPAMVALIQNQKKEIDELTARLDRMEANN